MKKFAILIAAVVMVLGFLQPTYAITLWYNGDFDYRAGLANEINTAVTHAMVYDDFVVPSGGWTIQGIWSNNLMEFTGVNAAQWEIRSGVSSGDGGLVFAFSTSSPASQTPTGRSFGVRNEYTIEVTGMNIPIPPGTYWLGVAPIGFGSGRSFLSSTSGANAIGTPLGNNDNSFFDSPYFGYNFAPANWLITYPADFSMGIAGVGGGPVIPEPTTISLLGMGLLGLVGLKKKRS